MPSLHIKISVSASEELATSARETEGYFDMKTLDMKRVGREKNRVLSMKISSPEGGVLYILQEHFSYFSNNFNNLNRFSRDILASFFDKFRRYYRLFVTRIDANMSLFPDTQIGANQP